MDSEFNAVLDIRRSLQGLKSGGRGRSMTSSPGFLSLTTPGSLRDKVAGEDVTSLQAIWTSSRCPVGLLSGYADVALDQALANGEMLLTQRGLGLPKIFDNVFLRRDVVILAQGG